MVVDIGGFGVVVRELGICRVGLLVRFFINILDSIGLIELDICWLVFLFYLVF